MSMRVVVVGGGIAGLSCAYYLRRRDFDVTVVESNRIGSGASFANGGWLCPAQAGPLPEPGLTLYGMRTFLDRDSALYFQPAYFPRLAPWLLRFWTYCNERDHAHGTSAIARLGHDIFDLVEQMRADGVECELYKQGMVFAARSPDDARNELRKLQPMREHGYDLPDDILTGAELHELEPALSRRCERFPDPRALARAARLDHGRPGRRAAPRRRRHPRGRRGGRAGAAGQPVDRRCAPPPATSKPTSSCWRPGRGRRSWPARSANALPMEPGKGYSFYARPEVMPSHAILLADVHVGCTPYGERIRIGGTMEFSGVNTRLDRRRINSIVTGAKESFLPWKTGEIEAEWAGMRPIPADGLPIIDRFGTFENTYVTTGHGMQGMTLAPPSGHALAEMIDDRAAPATAGAVPARPLPAHRAATRRPPAGPRGVTGDRRLRVAIIGSGNIGTDLMIKVERSPLLEVAGMAGIDPSSAGLQTARDHGHVVSDQGLAGLLELVGDIDLAFDATSAARPCRARPPAGRARHPQRRPDAGGARARGRSAGEPDGAPGCGRGQPRHLWRPGHDSDRRRPQRRRRGGIRRDRLDHLVALGRAGHAAEHRRVHDGHGARPRDHRRRAPGEGDHHPQPGEPADHDAQHHLRRDGRVPIRQPSRRPSPPPSPPSPPTFRATG